MEKPKTGLDNCLIILLSCFGKNKSVDGSGEGHKTYTHMIHGYGHTWATREVKLLLDQEKEGPQSILFL